MSGASNEEHSNLYMRGVNEATSGAELDAQAVLDELGAFGEEGVRIYLIGVLEGTETLVEEEIEEYEMLEASTPSRYISLRCPFSKTRRRRYGCGWRESQET